MEGITKQLQDTYRLLESIPVSGPYVETMTAIRIIIRNILTELQKEVSHDGG